MEPEAEVAFGGVLPAGTVIGGYRVAGRLGRGTSAVVHAADGPDGPVALKVGLAGTAEDGVARARFLRGARAQAGLDHPAIVAVRAVGEDPVHGPWMAMELIDGPTLGVLHGAGALPGARALALLAQVAAGLDAAHAAGVVHRDVKPSNVLVDGDRALLADFGLARDGDRAHGTATGAVIGTLPYLAPELVQGGDPTPAGDRYALAAIAYELLVGETVFPRPTDAAILFAHVDEPVPAASGRRPALPAGVDAALARGLAKDPAARPPAAAALVDEIARALGGTLATLPAPAPRADTTAATVAPTTSAGGVGLGGATGGEEAAPVPGRARRGPSPRVRLAVLGALAAAGAAGGAVVLAPSDDGGARAADPLSPALAAGHLALGSALVGPASAIEGRDCRDRRAATGSSPACTLLQTELPGRRLVVPRSGAIRAFTLRGARGELVLQVLRRRDRQVFQVVRSQPVVVRAARQRFATALPAEPGDLVGLAVLPGAQVGVLPAVPGARTERWTDPVSAQRDPGRRTGFRHEVLLQVDFEPGGRVPPPAQVTGAAARALADGREVAAGDTLLPDGRRVRLALVEVGRRVYVDLYRGGARRARCLVPDLVAGGSVVGFKPFQSEGNPSQLNVAWRNAGTRTDVEHYFGLDAEALEFYS